MNSAQNNISVSSSIPTSGKKQSATDLDINNIGASVVQAATGVSKEVAPGLARHESVKEIPVEVELSKEVEKAGVIKVSQTIEFPPDVKKLAGVSTPVSTSPPATTIPQVYLPISDDKVFEGEKKGVTDAWSWLALWCIKKLRKAHIILKKIHGKVIRILTK